MTDLDLRKLVLLADVRATIDNTDTLVRKLALDLRRLSRDASAIKIGDPFYTAARAAETFELSLIEIREVVSKLITEVSQ